MKILATLFSLLVLFSSCEQNEPSTRPNSTSPAKNTATEDPFTDENSLIPELPEKAEAPSAQLLALRENLNSIIIPRVDFKDTLLEQAVVYFIQKSIELDSQEPPNRRGISFVIEQGSVTTTFSDIDEDLGGGSLLLGREPNAKIIPHYQATNIPLGQAITQALALCDFEVYLEEWHLTIRPKGQKLAENSSAILLWDESLEEAAPTPPQQQ